MDKINMRVIVNEINDVGLSKLRRYVAENKKVPDIERNIRIARYAAKHGYVEAGRIFKISWQAVRMLCVNLYTYALEIKAIEEGKKD